MPKSEFAELRSALESVAAQRAEIRLKIRRRQLVKVERLKHRVVDIAHVTRDSLMNGPIRHVPTLAAAHGLNPAAVYAVLTKTMRATLTKASKDGPGEIHDDKADGST